MRRDLYLPREARIERVSDDENAPEPWLPPSVTWTLMVASVFVGAVGGAALIESPAAAIEMLGEPSFYVILVVAVGSAILVVNRENQ